MRMFWREGGVGRLLGVFAVLLVVLPVVCGGAQIEGRVTGTGAVPLANIWVWAYTQTGGTFAAITDTNGNYAVMGLAADTYYVRTGVMDLDYVDEWYDDVPVLGDGSKIPPAATGLVLLGSTVQTGIDFVLAEGGRIAGRVTAESGGSGIANATVQAWREEAEPRFWGQTTTDGAGYYEMKQLPPGTYQARTVLNGFGGNYVDEWYSNVVVDVADLPTGTNVPAGALDLGVVGGTTISNVNFALGDGAIIRGSVICVDTGPMQNKGVLIVWGTNGSQSWLRSTDTNGNYEVEGLPTGTYYVRTMIDDVDYTDEWWDNVVVNETNPPLSATALVLTAGVSVVENIDFLLGEFFVEILRHAGGVALEWTSPSTLNLVENTVSLTDGLWHYETQVLDTNWWAVPVVIDVDWFRVRKVKVVTIPDTSLDQVLSNAIGGAKLLPIADLYDADLALLTNVNGDAQAPAIQDLSGLEHCSSLMFLSLATNAVTDISSLITNAAGGGLGSGDVVNLQSNLLTDTNQVTELRSYGVTVLWP